MASKKLLLFEEITPDTGRKVFAGGYSEIVLCTDGGDIDVMRAICEYLTRHPKRITVAGRCQSAGVLIAAAGHEVLAYPGVEWLHHLASMEVEGSARDLDAAAEALKRQEAWASGFLEKSTGRPAREWTADAFRETVFTNREALKWGLLDREL